jgi:carbonic anhydrase/acetyltransferase-like protein (isoleucine patch superfamily)
MYNNNHNPLSWIRGLEKGNVTILEDAWIGPFTVIDGEYDKIHIGKGVNVSSGAQILTHDTVQRCITNREYNKIDHQPTTIEDHVFIGTNAVILKGCIVGTHSVVAAGAVLKDNTIVPPHSLVYGVPAKIKPLNNKINDTI